MKNVLLMLGAFDPITTGHIKLAQFVLSKLNYFNEAWITPCYKHIYNKKMESPEHRMEMCSIATKNDPRLKMFPYEVAHKITGGTYNFVEKLLSEDFSKDKKYSIVVGMDNANTLHKWINCEKLLEMINFIVVSRQGIERNNNIDWYKTSPHIFLEAGDEVPLTSSTDVRTKLGKDEYLDGLIDEDVFKYIVEYGLYMPKKINDL